MREYDELDTFFEKVAADMQISEESSKFAKYFYAACFKGKSTFYQKNITKTQIFDDEWIRNIESFIPSIDAIIRQPRVAIQYEEEVVAIEKAKKTNSASVRHLSSHTQLIKNVVRGKDGDTEIQPKKILTTYADEMIATYENRFIMTLIDKLFLFIRRRYEVIQSNIRSFQRDHMVFESHFDINDSTVDTNIEIAIERDLDDEKLSQTNKDMLKRVQYLMDYASSFKNSAFMKRMIEEKAKKVIPPIMKTNVILKNVDFRNAYMLWLFLDHYYKLGFDVEVRERNVKLNDNFEINLHRLSLMTYSLVMNNIQTRKAEFADLKDVKPTVKKSTKIALNNPKDFVDNPHAIKMEDGIMNEYYLQENKKVFDKGLKAKIEEGMKEPKALRKAIEETLEISDTLYQTIFYLKEDVDYFDMMAAQVDDPQKDYDDCMYKIKLAKEICEAKEASYKKSLQLERELVKKMQKASEMLLRAKLKQKAEETKKRQQEKIDKEIAAFKEKKKENQETIKYLEGRKIDIQTNKSQLQAEFDEMKRKVDEQAEIIKAEEKAKLEAELQEIMLKHEEKMNKLKAMEAAKLKLAKQHQQERLAAEKAKVAQQIKAIRDEEQARRAAIIAKAKADNALKEAEAEAKLQAKVDEINAQTNEKADEIQSKGNEKLEKMKAKPAKEKVVIIPEPIVVPAPEVPAEEAPKEEPEVAPIVIPVVEAEPETPVEKPVVEEIPVIIPVVEPEPETPAEEPVVEEIPVIIPVAEPEPEPQPEPEQPAEEPAPVVIPVVETPAPAEEPVKHISKQKLLAMEKAAKATPVVKKAKQPQDNSITNKKMLKKKTTMKNVK